MKHSNEGCQSQRRDTTLKHSFLMSFHSSGTQAVAFSSCKFHGAQQLCQIKIRVEFCLQLRNPV